MTSPAANTPLCGGGLLHPAVAATQRHSGNTRPDARAHVASLPGLFPQRASRFEASLSWPARSDKTPPRRRSQALASVSIALAHRSDTCRRRVFEVEVEVGARQRQHLVIIGLCHGRTRPPSRRRAPTTRTSRTLAPAQARARARAQTQTQARARAQDLLAVVGGNDVSCTQR
jgi:hypothetical protein